MFGASKNAQHASTTKYEWIVNKSTQMTRRDASSTGKCKCLSIHHNSYSTLPSTQSFDDAWSKK